jgi:DNA repair exonuclease SbcCD ATPase subunit
VKNLITFKKLRWKNFLSTGNLFTEIDFLKSSTTLIVGENGSGKSTMLDALTFALFNKPFRKINKVQLINTITNKDCVVEIEFDIGINHYKIIRGIKPNTFEVYKNDSLLNQSAENKDYQEILEKQILKLNYRSFCQVVVLGSASFVPFMQLPGGQRREVIEDLLDLKIFTVMNSLLKDKVASNSEMLTDVTTKQKITLEKLKLIKNHLLEKQTNNEKLVLEKIERIEETENKIKELTNKVINLNDELTEFKKETEEESKINSRIKKLDALKHQIEAKLAILNKDVKFFTDHKDCPTCKQEIAQEFRAVSIENKKIEIDEIEDGLSKLCEQYDEAMLKMNRIMEVISQINSKQLDIYKINNQIESHQKYCQQLEKEINSINETHLLDENDKLNDLSEELQVISEEYNKVSEEKQIYNAVSILLKDTGIKAKIIKQYIPIINKFINKYLSAMEFLVQFELDEEFNETIKSRYRDEFSYASFSEGEKMRINLSVLFTWRSIAKLRNSINTNILIMDEVFDSSLDSNGTEEFLKIINNLTSGTNTFIISHKSDQLYDKFANVIRFEKNKNFSRII